MSGREQVASADRGALIDWGRMSTGIVRANVIDGVPYVEVLAMHSGGREECVLQGGVPMGFPEGDLSLLDVVLGGREPIVTLRFTARPWPSTGSAMSAVGQETSTHDGTPSQPARRRRRN